MTGDIEQQMPCAAGCKRPGSETPRAASHGAYCDRCYYKYANALALAADLVEHVASLITFNGQQDDKVDSSRDAAPVPFNLQAFHDANETFRRLAYWTTVWAETLNEEAPRAASKVWRDRRGRIVGLRAGAPAATAQRNVSVVATWLTNRLDKILALPSDDLTFWGEELEDIYRINARWPREMKARYSDARCPDDDCQGRIAVYPPREFGQDERIVCEACGRWFEPHDYERLIGVFQQVMTERKRTEQTARHLMRKYGIGT